MFVYKYNDCNYKHVPKTKQEQIHLKYKLVAISVLLRIMEQLYFRIRWIIGNCDILQATDPNCQICLCKKENLILSHKGEKNHILYFWVVNIIHLEIIFSW